MKTYRVFYEETLSYEEYIEARDPQHAQEIFTNTLETDGIEPRDMIVNEFEAIEVEV